MPEPHDFTAGVTIRGLTFRIADAEARFEPNTWMTSEDRRLRHHGAGIEDDLTPQTIARIIEAKPEGANWEVIAAESLRGQLREVVEGLEAEQRQADTFMHELEGPGVVVETPRGNVVFTLHQGFTTDCWQVGRGGVQQDANDPDSELSADTIRSVIDDWAAADGDNVLRIYAADNLRDRLAGIARNLQAKESRREEDQRDGERMEEVTEQAPPIALRFSGRVTLDDDGGKPRIDGTDVIEAFDAHWGHQSRRHIPVEVYLGVEHEPAITAAGQSTADAGWVGTDETPGEVPRIEVGGFDLLGKLHEFDGRHVELVVREVERPGPFYIEVDPRIEDETWKIDDLRFGGKPRRDKELTGEKLVELIDAKVASITVSFLSASRVYRAIDEYHSIEREAHRVLPVIEVVPGKGDPAYTVGRSVELMDARSAPPHFVAGVARAGFGLAGMENPEELAAAQRALEAHRTGKLVVILDERIANGPWWRSGSWAANDLDQAIAFAREARDTKAEGTEPPAEQPAEPADDELDQPGDVVMLHEGKELTVYVDRRLGEGEWNIAEGIDPEHRFTGDFTTDKVRSLIAQHHEVFTVGLDLLPNAIAVLVGIGEVDGRRDISKWCEEIREKLSPGSMHFSGAAYDFKPPERTASERIVLAIRGAIKEVESDLRAANREAFRGRAAAFGMFAAPTSAALNNSYERLMEALMWADKHEEQAAAAAQRVKGMTAAELMAEQLRDAGLHIGSMKPGS